MGTSGHSRTKERFAPRFCYALALFLVSIMLTACGGGSSSAMSSSASSSIASVTPACAPAAVATNATAQCTVAVKGSGSYSSAVLSSASSGTVSSSGGLHGPGYGRPRDSDRDQHPGPRRVGQHLRHGATGGSSTVTSVQVACNPSAVSLDGTSQCAATVKGTGSFSSAVTWSATAGTISTGGLFTAPGTAGAATVTATRRSGQAQSPVQPTVAVQGSTAPPPHIALVMKVNGKLRNGPRQPHRGPTSTN